MSMLNNGDFTKLLRILTSEVRLDGASRSTSTASLQKLEGAGKRWDDPRAAPAEHGWTEEGGAAMPLPLLI